MSVPSFQYPLTDGTFAYGSQVFANLSVLLNALTANLDSTNISAARGIGANYIASSGVGGASGAFQPGAYSFSSASAGQTPLTVNVGGSQTANVVQFFGNLGTGFAVGPFGTIVSTALGTSTFAGGVTGPGLGYFPPCFNASGAGNAIHIVTGVSTTSFGVATVTLSGAAAFLNASSYIVLATASGTNIVSVSGQASGTQFTLGANANTVTIFWMALGF